MKNPPFSNDLKSFPYISMGFPFISSRFLWISIVQTGRHRASASQGVFTPCSSILTVESQSPNFALEKSFGFQKNTCVIHIYNYHRIGWIENLRGTPLFDGKNHGFRFRFSSVYIYIHISNKSPEGSSCIMGLCLFPVRILHMMLYHWISTLQAE